MAASSGTALPNSCQTEDTAEAGSRLPLAASPPSPEQPRGGQALPCAIHTHLMALALVLGQQDDGICQRGGLSLHLLHHHQAGAVDG